MITSMALKTFVGTSNIIFFLNPLIGCAIKIYAYAHTEGHTGSSVGPTNLCKFNSVKKKHNKLTIDKEHKPLSLDTILFCAV